MNRKSVEFRPKSTLGRGSVRRAAFFATVRRFAAVAIPAALAALGCQRDEWSGFIYPDQSDLTDSRHVGTFETLEDCRAVALAELHAIEAAGSGDYECGLNCKPAFPDIPNSGYVCKETLR